MRNLLSWRYFFTLSLLFVLSQVNAIVACKNVSSPDSLKCGEILLKNGKHIKAVIMAITTDSVRYRICDNQKKTPALAHSKKEINKVVAADGAILFRSIEAENNVNESDTNRKLHPQAIMGAVFTALGALCSILNLVFLSFDVNVIMPWKINWNFIIALFAIGFLFAITALVLIRRNIKKYKGEKITLASIIIGGIILGLFLVDHL